MKEMIFQEYGYRIDTLIYRKNSISMFYDNSNYVIQEIDLEEKDIEFLVSIVDYLEKYNIFFHKIIKGKNNYIFSYGNKRYVLMNLRIVVDRMITFSEILNLINIDIKPLNISKIDPAARLESKIDFLEKYMANYEKKYVFEDLNYYLGLAESSIILYRMFDYNEVSVSHKRLSANSKTLDFYNPLNIIIDIKVRDIAEYVKSAFFYKNENIVFQVFKYLKPNEFVFYFIRILYPSYYFDCLESIIMNDENDECIKKISAKANLFEKNIKKLYYELKMHLNMPYIEWLSDINDF